MDYKATLNLPKTSFPMKANLPQTEPQMLAWWEQIGIYKRLREAAADRPLWILHDGPPYANGNIHMGHVLNKVLKDIVVKSRSMLGFNAVYVPGFDCHGLPIEHQVDKELGLDKPGVDVRRAMDPVEKIRRCRAYAQKFVDIQREEFQRLGVFGDWDNPYATMTPAYEGVIAREFGRLVGRGLVYKGLKPVHWCMYCKTALAQAEVEYEDQRTPSVYVKFPLLGPLPAVPDAPRPSLVIWTTTPWTLPANLGVAVHADEEYVALEARGETLVVAAKLAEAFTRVAKLGPVRERAPRPRAARSRVSSTAIRGSTAPGRSAVGDFVAMDAGTGLVHIAPGHGEEDYELGRKHGLKIYNPVDDDGRFVADVEHFAGLTVWEANPKIVALLRERGALVAEVALDHTYPHCWRCKNPTLFRATEQWFVALDKDGLRARTLDAIRRDVTWIPPVGRRAHLQHGRPPAGLDALAPARVGRADRRLLLRGLRGAAARAGGRRPRGADLRRGPRDRRVARAHRGGAAAARHAVRAVRRHAVPQGDRHARRVVRLRLQPRGRAGDAARAPLAGRAVPRGLGPASRLVPLARCWRRWPRAARRPYKAVLTCGFVVDGEGRKMSKSVGNAVKPDESLAKYGAEVLRLWVAAEDYTEDIRLSSEIIDRLADAYRRIRNTFRFLLGNLADFDPARDRQPYGRLDEVDRWVLDRLARLIDRVGHAYEEYQFHTVFHACTTSARWTCRRCTSTSSRTASTRPPPATRGAAPPRPRARTSSARCSA